MKRPREQWVRCTVRVSVTVRPYRLARNTTPEKAHERTRTPSRRKMHTHAKHERTHAMVTMDARERERGREAARKRKEPGPRRVKSATRGRGGRERGRD